MKVINIPQRTLANQTIRTPEDTVPVGAEWYDLTFDITQFLDPVERFEISCEVSQDNGATWEYGGGASRFGGVGFAKDGVTPLTTAGLRVTARNPQNPNRRIRAAIAAFGTFVIGPGTLTIGP